MEADLALLDTETESFLKNLGIPPCPAILVRLTAMVRGDDPDFHAIAELVSADVALSATMLSTVNSAYYGLRTKATTVYRALSLLGLHTCTQLLTRLTLARSMPAADTPAMKRFFATALRNSIIAAIVARSTRLVDPELASTFVLFRDAGMGLLIARHERYGQLLEPAVLYQGVGLLDEELTLCGVNHARVGFQLARSWELATETQLAIFNHHTYGVDAERRAAAPRLALRLVAIGLVVDTAACRITRMPNREWEENREFALETLDLDDADIDEIVREATIAAPPGVAG
jgi:HD-like signal output (HDOD) protein